MRERRRRMKPLVAHATVDTGAYVAPVRLFIFDADDTLRRTTTAGKPCPHAPGEWELLPKVETTLRRIRWGPGAALLGVASNQDQVAYGWLSEAMARRLLEEMIAAATGCDPSFAAIELCVHPLEVQCDCRKPAPGMLLRILRHFDIAPEHALFVGDAGSDQEAARRGGIAFVSAKDFFGWEF